MLRRSHLFAGLGEADLADILSLAQPLSFEPGGHIFGEGDTARGFYVVAGGTVKVYKLSPGGREQVIHHLGSGEAFGEVALFAGSTFPASAAALSAARVLFFPKEAFLAQVAARPALALNMIATLALRLRGFAALVEALALQDVAARVAAYLDELSRAQGALSVTLPVTKAELAASLGMAQETLSRALRRLKEAGVVAVSGRRLTILEPARLKEFLNPA